MNLLELQALLLTLKEHGVKEYKDSHVQLAFAEVPRNIRGISEVAREQGATSTETYARQEAPVPEELQGLNPLYFDPALGLEITRRG